MLIPILPIYNHCSISQSFSRTSESSDSHSQINVLLGSAHYWTTVSAHSLSDLHSKRNYLIFDALKMLEDTSIDFNVIAPEYGPDVDDSKQYAANLGLTSINWIPKQSQDNMISLIDSSHICIGEFYIEPTVFGGFGYEALSRYKVFINGGSLDFYYSCLSNDTPLPPNLYLANSANDIFNCLLSVITDNNSPISNSKVDSFFSSLTEDFNQVICDLSTSDQ